MMMNERSILANEPKLSSKEKKKLRNELWVVIPFLITSLFFFVESFNYKFQARILPMLVGFVMTLVTAMRLFYIFFSGNRLRIGEFKEGGLAEEFDEVKENIEKELVKGNFEKGAPRREITSRDERKAFIPLIACFFAFLLFGYLVGIFIAIVGVSFYYGYRERWPLITSLISMYLIVYVILYRLLGAPEDFGLLLDPVLRSLHLI
jgi:hypothetical protein